MVTLTLVTHELASGEHAELFGRRLTLRRELAAVQTTDVTFYEMSVRTIDEAAHPHRKSTSCSF